MDLLTWQERMMLFREGPEGPELLWLWLIERGLLFCLHSWDAVFRMANRRCREVLVPVGAGWIRTGCTRTTRRRMWPGIRSRYSYSSCSTM
ncbi:hypothetical protein ACFRFJ_30560 [Streptomyces hydrogenans]|uniref:hypothetical protein n=1 Tax=Streptomyces hydrogenans TaxID=1873719 RepID=UPI0036BD033D